MGVFVRDFRGSLSSVECSVVVVVSEFELRDSGNGHKKVAVGTWEAKTVKSPVCF